MSNKWYVFHSKPNMENVLWMQLLDRKVETYFPRLSVKPVNPRSRKIIPYFPGYLFANLDLDNTSISTIAWLPGMQRIVAFDGEPAWVPDHLMHALIKQVEAANQVQQDPYMGLQPGDLVRIDSGPFEGYPAIFDTRLDGSQRARVLIKFLQQRQVRVDIPVSQISKARLRR